MDLPDQYLASTAGKWQWEERGGDPDEWSGVERSGVERKKKGFEEGGTRRAVFIGNEEVNFWVRNRVKPPYVTRCPSTAGKSKKS